MANGCGIGYLCVYIKGRYPTAECRCGQRPTEMTGWTPGEQRRFSRHAGSIRPMCVLADCRDEGSARSLRFLPRCPHIGSNEPHQAIPRQGASLQSPLPFHLVSSFHLRQRNHVLLTVWLAGQAVLAVFLEDEILLSSLGDGQLRCALGTLRALHNFCTELVVAQRFASSQ